jgi:uncharacterized membrane protein
MAFLEERSRIVGGLVVVLLAIHYIVCPIIPH